MQLTVRNLSKKYPAGALALNNITLSLHDRKVTSLLGPNGAGKSTLVKCIMGLISPDNGSIHYANRDLIKEPGVAQQRIGIVFEEVSNVYGYLSVQENVFYYGYMNGLRRRQIQEFLDLWLERLELQEKISTPGFKLSRGMKQKLALIISLLKNPDLLILDEPSNGLDVLSRRKMIDVVKDLSHSQGKTLLLTTHDMPFAHEVSDFFHFIDHGASVWEGSAKQLEEAFGAEMSLENIFQEVLKGVKHT